MQQRGHPFSSPVWRRCEPVVAIRHIRMRAAEPRPRQTISTDWSRAFEICRGCHATGGTYRHHGPTFVAPAKLEKRASDISDSRHAVRMSERNGTAVDVRDLPRGLE